MSGTRRWAVCLVLFFCYRLHIRSLYNTKRFTFTRNKSTKQVEELLACSLVRVKHLRVAHQSVLFFLRFNDLKCNQKVFAQKNLTPARDCCLMISYFNERNLKINDFASYTGGIMENNSHCWLKSLLLFNGRRKREV